MNLALLHVVLFNRYIGLELSLVLFIDDGGGGGVFPGIIIKGPNLYFLQCILMIILTFIGRHQVALAVRNFLVLQFNMGT